MHNYLSSLHKNLPSLWRGWGRLLLLVFLSPCLPVSLSPSLHAQTVDGRNFGVDGFAAYEGEAGTKHYLAGATTGGAAGKVVKAETFSQLQAYLQAKDPYVILLDRDIEPAPVAYVNSIDEVIDEDHVEDIYEYFKESETDDLETAMEELNNEYDEDEVRLVRIKFLSEMAN